jgi:hypothetical protein
LVEPVGEAELLGIVGGEVGAEPNPGEGDRVVGGGGDLAGGLHDFDDEQADFEGFRSVGLGGLLKEPLAGGDVLLDFF